jgi:hypothetical protein
MSANKTQKPFVLEQAKPSPRTSVQRNASMHVRLAPYIEAGPPSILTNFDAFIPVRAPEGPRPDGYVHVYLPDGTAFVVNGRQLLRLDHDQSGLGLCVDAQAEPVGKDAVAADHR